MISEVIDNSPVYQFLQATFRNDPGRFIDHFLAVDFPPTQERFDYTIRELARRNIEQWMMPQYNDEVIRSYELIANAQWDSIRHTGTSSPFELMKRFVERILILQRDMPVYKISKANIWNALTSEMGEDIFVTTLLANIFDKQGAPPGHFQWNYIIPSSFSSLNNLLSEEQLVENHYHLSGSSPNVDLSWICLMNNPFGSEERFRRFPREDPYELGGMGPEKYLEEMKILVRIAAYIRIRLFEACCLEENRNRWNLYYVTQKILEIKNNRAVIYKDYMSEMINVCSFLSSYREDGRYVVDYAITDYIKRDDLNYIEISGERHFVYCCLRQIFRYDTKSFDIQVLFYIYLLIKNHFSGLFIQKNNKYGFNNFHRHEHSKMDIIRGTIYQKIAVRMALKYNVRENFIDKLEVRISPENEQTKLHKKIDNYDNEAGIDKGQFFYVLHFIKEMNHFETGSNKQETFIPVCREAALRSKLKREAFVVEKLRREPRNVSFRIFGIDAASHEVDCRPENFGQAFRFLSNLRHTYNYLHYDPDRVHLPDLHKTFHVGEDFYDIIDGLRAIDEAVLFLGLKHGDRIGHGVALGLDPEKYYKSRKNISMPLQNALDNIVWCLYCIEKLKVPISTSFYAFLKVSFDRYYNMLHQNIPDKGKPGPSDLMTYINSWKLRGDNPGCYFKKFKRDRNRKNLSGDFEWDRNNFLDRSKYSELDENTYNLYHWYHFDTSLKRQAATIVEFRIDEDYIQLTRQLQAIMRNFMLKKGVAIESNPTSNLRISNLDDAIHLPIFKLFPVSETKSGLLRINTSVNTDDQGVFYTSLVKEYTILANALQREYDENGLRVYSDDTILHWIGDLIANGKRQCFMQRQG
ncbi:MAG: hypothetical protein NT040_19705 [Bacteroidetes bacterium]|nr:hypothetical protein [Bacteroidota bacterium]